ncbi:hypothetical protein OSB04_016761 [Centaurea solstitialis]|uniref:Transposase n=1 Tax=Centaurea solstitialis TaxID=347529 RepID=A0AA38TCM7_9ASTR|nr:hypothetical protein OSB04_016761 [Centaurea solstitialis]
MAELEAKKVQVQLYAQYDQDCEFCKTPHDHLSVKMHDNVYTTIGDDSTPRWEIMVQSPMIEQVAPSYKLTLKYGGFFRLARNSCRQVYCLGYRKSIYMETCTYNMSDLLEDVRKHYPSKSDQVLSILFLDKNAKEQSFIQLDSHENFMVMLSMYKDEAEVTIYVTADKFVQQSGDEVIEECDDGNDSDSNCPSEESYHSRHSSDDEYEFLNDESESVGYSKNKKGPTMKVNSKFPNVVSFRKALNHYALTNEFEYVIEKSDSTQLTACCDDKKCAWRIHASLTQDGITFEESIRFKVKKFVDTHSCTRSNKCVNKHATQGWIAEVVTDKLKSDGDVSCAELQKWLMRNYNVDVPYMRVFKGKELAYNDMYGKWDDSFLKIDDFKEEIRKRNLGSVVEIDFETKGDRNISCDFFLLQGFLHGCRPYIGLDACHLKGRFNGVLAAATSIDGNNGMFSVAYGVLESENTKSWTWFLESLKKAIGTPHGLVISSDMQKGLEVAITQVYPNVEHRECMRHLYSNFKKHFRGDFFMLKLWGAANTYNVSKHDRLLNEIASVRGEAIAYLNENHKKIWSRSKFGTEVKCDYITNNISETFNSWIGELRYKPNLGEYQVIRSGDNRAEVKCKDERWEVLLDEKK